MQNYIKISFIFLFFFSLALSLLFSLIISLSLSYSRDSLRFRLSVEPMGVIRPGSHSESQIERLPHARLVV
jgi:hypothetical protein